MTETETAQNAEQPSAELVSVVVQGETWKVQNYLRNKVGLSFAGRTRGWVGTTTRGRVWFMTVKLGLTVRLVPPGEAAKHGFASPATEGAAPAPSPRASEGQGEVVNPSPRPGNHLRALEESRRACRDGSRSPLEDYLVYRGEGARRGARLNGGHWQPNPLDTVAGLSEGCVSSGVGESWAPEDYVDARLFRDDMDDGLHPEAILPGSNGWG